ncbi:hypothetical protein [Mammaliicoccus sciuri]|uniref:hypothetical protein n=1 Tax=Mammaliicoccus sciuri TaxID=1296 RepID=UPI001786B41B|nr:hypothetical protein [Mammaliicoccus sciuri]
MNLEENSKSYEMLYIEDELYQVIERFADVESINKYNFISKSGNKIFRLKEDLVGIFTPADISEIMIFLDSKN